MDWVRTPGRPSINGLCDGKIQIPTTWLAQVLLDSGKYYSQPKDGRVLGPLLAGKTINRTAGLIRNTRPNPLDYCTRRTRGHSRLYS